MLYQGLYRRGQETTIYTGVRSFTGMDRNGHGYRNGHCAVDLVALNIFYLHETYFCSHIDSFQEINFIKI